MSIIIKNAYSPDTYPLAKKDHIGFMVALPISAKEAVESLLYKCRRSMEDTSRFALIPQGSLALQGQEVRAHTFMDIFSKWRNTWACHSKK